MRRVVLKKMIIFVVIVLGIGLFSSCTRKEEQEALDIKSMNKMDFSIPQNEGAPPTCTYSDKEKTVFSIGKRNGSSTGPLVNTESFLVFGKDGEAQEIVMKDDAYIYNAVPFKNGVLYATYEITGMEKCKWYIKHIENEKVELIDQGQCDSYSNMPSIAYVGDTPYYQFTERTSQGIQEGVKRIVNGKAETLFSYKTDRMNSPFLCSNGVMFSYISQEGGSPLYVIGDKDGIKYKNTTKKKLASFGINDDVMLCSLAEDIDGVPEYEMLSVDLSTGEKTYSDTDQPYYRICGSGNAFLCIDGKWTLYLMKSDGKKISQKAVEYPESLELENRAGSFYSRQKNSFLVHYFVDDYREEEFYELVAN